MRQIWKLIVFDFDGVIADSMPVQEQAWRQTIRAVVNSRLVEERMIQNLYNGNAGQRMFDGLNVTTDVKARLRSAKDEIWLAIRDSTPLMTGAASALRQIAARYVVAVATTADVSYVNTLLSQDRVLSVVSRIVTDRDVPHPKPAPDMLLRLMTDFNIEPKYTCLIGDSRTDYEMSRSAGVDFIRFASHSGAADVMAPSVSSWKGLSSVLLRCDGGA